ncbi:MAG: sigma-70 family RNA polymerase sigma factor, partial [Myxococcota bacterium]
DAVHDLFVEVWQRAGDFDPRRGSVRTWIAMRLRSRCLDRLRRAKVRENKAPEARPPEPPDVIKRAVDEPKVRAALEQLGAPHREVVLLSYFAGLSSTEIAERLSIPVGTVKSRMRAALTALRGVLDPAGAGP